MNEADTLRIIEAEILGDNAEVKRRFLNHFNKELNDFIRAISEAYDRWSALPPIHWTGFRLK